MRHIDSADGAGVIASEILRDRSRPLVLISANAEGEFAFDAEAIAHALAGDADVATIETGEPTYALERLLPPKTHVFGGAARSYPPDFAANPEWQRSLLRFPGRRDDDLVEDALAQIVIRPVVAPVRRSWVRATVDLLSGSAAGNVAHLEDGQRVMIVADGLPASIRIADALEVGAHVEGWLTGVDLAPEAEPVDLAPLTEGSVTLARVIKVTDLRASLVLHPLAPEFVLRKRAVVPGVDNGENEDVRVSDVLRVGETVRVRITSDKAGVGLTLINAGGELPFVKPLPILRGGPPWLREGVHAVADAEPVAAARDVTPEPSLAPATPSAPSAGNGAIATAELAMIREEMAGLKDAFLRLGREVRAGTDLETLDQLRDQNTSLSEELHRARTALRDQTSAASRLRQEARDARNQRPEPQLSGIRTGRSAWPTEESWLRHEITGTWAARTLASEKLEHPLADYIVGPRFLASMREVGDAYTEKVLRGVVDALTDRAADIPGRQLHRLRRGQGGSDPYVTRSDGAVCWRLSLETNTPSARRLHYWQMTGGTYELSRVVLHDDVEP
ncbi:hypothetical protein BKA24_001151 [Microbacterium marinum]|uniref:S1 motif domain-containing protein n=1 Tax=Microbacterium marinum TaxID=421115 RepID=A0A7W7FHW0_9MICO|nr:hypothetical protein [Microbacterium marinum]MBB4666442.1 hypothetical protein [Microbacterium marinum]